MLEKIEYIFQRNSKNIELFNLLSELFENVKYITNIENSELQIIPLNLKPKTVFKLDDIVSNIELNIGDEKYLDLLTRKVRNDKYVSKIKRLPIDEVKRKLSKHIKRVDHTGINLPTILFSNEEWNDLLIYFSSISNIYNYPTGKPWPFLIPTTEYENQNEITNFQILRDPKFELVYDEYTNIIAIHIDVETDLSKAEIEKLFPKDQGVYFDGCDYKAIYLDYREDFDIRLDIRCNYNSTTYGDWENGEWLVNKGGRIYTRNIGMVCHTIISYLMYKENTIETQKKERF